jgi:fructosamine-3-kinase
MLYPPDGDISRRNIIAGRREPIPGWRQIVEETAGSRVAGSAPLSGGCLADLQLLKLENGERVVLKQGDNLLCEAYMLTYLGKHTSLPVPEVLHSAEDCILMEYLPGRANALDFGAERYLGEMIAELHAPGRAVPQFGFERDTVIGPLAQPNAEEDDWCVFFRDRRLMHMAGMARERGKLPEAVYGRVVALSERLEQFIGHKPSPSLLHGDLWGGNILADKGRVTGLIDPAVYFGDAEVELAFMTLFGTVGELFFEVYGTLRPLDPEFFRTRKDIYLTYPLLVHVCLFGGGYVGQLDGILQKYL